MINHISIQNFATIENIDIDFAEGLNIITGETGAGKSIIIEAVNLALGARADTAFVRYGQDQAQIQLVAHIDSNIRGFIGDDLSHIISSTSDEIIITREVSSAGKSTCRINDKIVTLATLKELCTHIADIHGQYDHQSLLDPEHHLALVDLYAKEEIVPQKSKVAGIFNRYSAVTSELRKLISSYEESMRQRDFMSFELDEISSAEVMDGEDEALSDKISILQNSEHVYSNLDKAYCMSTDDDYSAQSILSSMSDALGELSDITPDLEDISNRMNELYYELQDLTSRIRSTRDSVTFSEEELNEAIQRLDEIERLKGKYGGSIEAMNRYAAKLSDELSKVENIDDLKAELTEQKESLASQLAEESDKLTALRRKYATELTGKILAELKDLNFNDAQLDMEFETGEYSADGHDTAQFMISTNRGEPLKPLARIASGGEMSRIMLAFKKIVGDYDRIPSMIFDEIDSGISGITASIVGRKLRQISDSHQIICITHLPQIAACGMHNYRITKEVRGDRTYTDILPLDDESKTAEIARLLGGDNITDTTLASARELIAASS